MSPPKMENYLKDKVGNWENVNLAEKAESMGKVPSCECCNSTRRLTKHHLVPKSARRLKDVKYLLTEPGYNPHYTMVLCEKCHVELHQMKSNKELALNFNTPLQVVELLRKYEYSSTYQRLNGLCFDTPFVNVFEGSNIWN